MSERQGTRCKYLLDASALYPILISDLPFNPDACAVTSLTEYEIGNVLWKENRRSKIDDPKRVAAIFSEAMHPLRKLEVDSMADVLAISIQRGLTFYDASYAHLAETKKLKLVTKDAELLKKCAVAISVEEMLRDKDAL